ncbi:hypothetical protein PIB30_083978 [Stylosanthes scabra]|uniref:CCHC-type domain-containing protein n=1 Tax=Stylosanthes scabra TaxID=79078 RepID=A0ABU6UR90_9FABA|nr:hypothetical protein [Stylosanthes scabra]
MNPNKVRKTFEVTCSKCGEKGYYYRTCKNNPQDSNWKPMTKKERRTTKGSAAATASNSQHSNTQAKAKKNKKKIPKPDVRVKPPKKKSQSDEIPISQSAPNAKEHGNASSQILGQGVNPQPNVAVGLQAT